MTTERLIGYGREDQEVTDRTRANSHDGSRLLLRDYSADLKRPGVQSLEVFGSLARGEARPDSDVDLLVEFEGPATFDRSR